MFTFRTAHVLTGTLTLALYAHNSIIPILARQGTTKYYARNVGLAYTLSTLTYLVMGVLFLLSFPLTKACIADNLLRNFHEQNPWAFAARLLMFFHLMSVFLIVMYVTRTIMMTTMFNDNYPSWIHVFVLNFFVMIACLLFCIFYPSIGNIIRYAPTLSITLPLPCARLDEMIDGQFWLSEQI
jgi:hypothetical protein